MGNKASKIAKKEPQTHQQISHAEDVKLVQETPSPTLNITEKPQSSIFSIAGKKLHLDAPEDARELVKEMADMQGLQQVIFSGNTISVGCAKALSAALTPHIAVEEVVLADCFTGRLKDEVPLAIESFGQALSSLPQLRSLDLSDNALGPVGAKAIAAFLPKCTSLRHLYLANNGLGPEGGTIIAEALAASPFALYTLVIGRNRLENGACEAMSRALAKHSSSLRTVRFYQNGIRPEGSSLLLKEGLSQCNALELLDLQDNTITTGPSKILASLLPSWPHLKALDIGDCLLGAEGALAVLQALSPSNDHPEPCPQLSVLNLAYAELDSVGAQYLLDHFLTFVRLKTLQSLSLNGNAFNPDGAIADGIRRKFTNADRDPETILDAWDDMDWESSSSSSQDEDDEEEQEEERGDKLPEQESKLPVKTAVNEEEPLVVEATKALKDMHLQGDLLPPPPKQEVVPEVTVGNNEEETVAEDNQHAISPPPLSQE